MFSNVLAFIIALGDLAMLDAQPAPPAEPVPIAQAVQGDQLRWVFADSAQAKIAQPNLDNVPALDLVPDLPASRQARARFAKRTRKSGAVDLRLAIADSRRLVPPPPVREARSSIVLDLGSSPSAADQTRPTDRGRGFVRLGDSDAGHTLWREDDGLFYVSARINGAVVRLIVDTGASFTVLSAEDARRVGVDPSQIAFAESADTAAGATRMARIVLANLEIGQNVAAGVPAMVASGPLRTSLLGQNVLSRLGSVTIEGDRMTMR